MDAIPNATGKVVQLSRAQTASVASVARVAGTPRTLIVGCAVSCYGKAPGLGITRASFKADSRFDTLFNDAPDVVTLSVLDCVNDKTMARQMLDEIKQAQRVIEAATSTAAQVESARQQQLYAQDWLLDALDPTRAVLVIADQIGGAAKLLTTRFDVLLDHEFSHAWTRPRHAETYRWFMAQIRAACPEASIDQYGSIARDAVRFRDASRLHEISMMDEAARDMRLGLGNGCFPAMYVPYAVGTMRERIDRGNIPWSVEDLRAFIASNLGRFEYVADGRSVRRSQVNPAESGGCLVLSPWRGDKWDVTEDGLTDFTANPRVPKQVHYEILLEAQRRGWRVMYWSGCTNARQAEVVAQALEQEVLPAVQAVRSGERPAWAW